MTPEILILGGGESGVGAAHLAVAKGLRARLSDAGVVRDSFAEELNQLDIPWESGGHSKEKWGQISMVVKSPGIPDDAAVVVELRKKGIPVISEIEFAAQHTKARLIGITGTNGKTTTTPAHRRYFSEGGLEYGMRGQCWKQFRAIRSRG